MLPDSRIGTRATLVGTMTVRRDLGGIVFATLVTQEADEPIRCVAQRPECREALRHARVGDSLCICGIYAARPRNLDAVEVHVDEVSIRAMEAGSANPLLDERAPFADQIVAELSAYRPREVDTSFYDYLDEAEVRSQLRILGIEPYASGLEALRPAINAYGMDYDAADRLTQALPTLRMLGASGRPERYFRDLWKLLSNDTVSRTIEARGCAPYSILTNAGVITHHDQLRHIDVAALDKATSVDGDDSLLRRTQRRLLAHSGGQFPNLLSLVASDPGLVHEYDVLIAATKARMSSPILFSSFRRESGVSNAVARCLRLCSLRLFLGASSREIAREAAKVFRIDVEAESDLLLEILYWSHRPPNHSFESFKKIAAPLITSSPSPTFVRTNWSRTKSILLRAGRTQFSPLSRVSAGICTAGHSDLDRRPDYAHIDMFDLRSCRVAGNIQLYECGYDRGQALALRGVNPAADLIARHGTVELLSLIIAFAATIAEKCGFRSLTLIEPLGVLKVEAARGELRAILSWAIPNWKRVRFTTPVELFHLCGRTISAIEGFEIWTR